MGIGWPGGSSGGGTFPPTTPTIVPAWFRIGVFNFEDFAADNTQTNIVPYDIPARAVIHGALVTPLIRFDGVDLVSYTIQCGVSGEIDRFTSPLDVAVIVPGSTVKQLVALFDQVNYSTETAFWITAISDGTSLDLVTAGEFALDLLISVPPALPT